MLHSIYWKVEYRKRLSKRQLGLKSSFNHNRIVFTISIAFYSLFLESHVPDKVIDRDNME